MNEKKFKIGDWVVDERDTRLWIGKISIFNNNNLPYCDMWYSKSGKKGNSGSTDNQLRLATPEEIAMLAGVKINSHSTTINLNFIQL